MNVVSLDEAEQAISRFLKIGNINTTVKCEFRAKITSLNITKTNGVG
jgi:hypothetical protein